MEVLEKRFGNAFVVSEAIRDRLYDWPEIDGKDHIGLRDFADYLQQCNMAMEHLEGLNILNDCREKTPNYYESCQSTYTVDGLEE